MATHDAREAQHVHAVLGAGGPNWRQAELEGERGMRRAAESEVRRWQAETHQAPVEVLADEVCSLWDLLEHEEYGGRVMGRAGNAQPAEPIPLRTRRRLQFTGGGDGRG